MSKSKPPNQKKKGGAVTFTDEELNELRAYCKLAGMTLSGYIAKLHTRDRPRRLRETEAILKMRRENPEVQL
jgi:hypothetical protein